MLIHCDNVASLGEHVSDCHMFGFLNRFLFLSQDAAIYHSMVCLC